MASKIEPKNQKCPIFDISQWNGLTRYQHILLYGSFECKDDFIWISFATVKITQPPSYYCKTSLSIGANRYFIKIILFLLCPWVNLLLEYISTEPGHIKKNPPITESTKSHKMFICTFFLSFIKGIFPRILRIVQVLSNICCGMNQMIFFPWNYKIV